MSFATYAVIFANAALRIVPIGGFSPVQSSNCSAA
jgi:hypothetical protein